MKHALLYFAMVLMTIQSFGQNVKTLDLTSKSDQSKYFVVLCGRNNSATGHAFIVWGKEDAIAQQSIIEAAFGLYSKNSGSSSTDGSAIFKAFFSKVPGEIADEFYKGSLTQDLIRLIIQVDKVDYDKTFGIKNTWEGRNDYQIIENDCITFATEVTKSLGLTIPVRGLTDRPWNYVDKFLSSNNQSNFLSGVWESSDPIKRFKLEITKTNCIWTERTQGGQTIVKTAEIKKENGIYKIYRPNDNEVLTFLGYQNNIRSQILARGANRSFIDIKRIDGKNLQGLWNGLIIIKDTNANLKEIKQPGTTPAKQFDFIRL